MKRWWRLWRWALAALLAPALLFGVGVLCRWPVAYPFDVLLNLGAAVELPALRAPDDGVVRVVVLQHGLFRTPASLSRLQRCLEAHGYEVLNPGYPSTADRIEAHTERLAQAVSARAALGPVGAWYFVGHSLGGLVIQHYLRRADHVAPTACVYLGTPHRGAVLADLRRHWFVFGLAMGDGAAKQLAASDPWHRQPVPYLECSGAVIGDLGDGNRAIPGRDDGTVGVLEASLGGAHACLTLPLGHTSLTTAPATHRAVLQFLRDRTFPTDPPPR